MRRRRTACNFVISQPADRCVCRWWDHLPGDTASDKIRLESTRSGQL